MRLFILMENEIENMSKYLTARNFYEIISRFSSWNQKFSQVFVF